jgi:hypothetical protein
MMMMMRKIDRLIEATRGDHAMKNEQRTKTDAF